MSGDPSQGVRLHWLVIVAAPLGDASKLDPSGTWAGSRELALRALAAALLVTHPLGPRASALADGSASLWRCTGTSARLCLGVLGRSIRGRVESLPLADHGLCRCSLPITGGSRSFISVPLDEGAGRF